MSPSRRSCGKSALLKAHDAPYHRRPAPLTSPTGAPVTMVSRRGQSGGLLLQPNTRMGNAYVLESVEIRC